MFELEKIKSMDKKSLRAFAEKKSQEILIKIDQLSKRIQEAKEDAEDAQNMDTGGLFGGKTKKKATATAEALVRTSKVMAEMSKLIQESIKFTCLSVAFSTVMHQTMAAMVVNGFKGTSGKVVKLNEDSKEFAEMIISQAEDFTKKQLQIENLQNQQKKNIRDLKGHSDKKDAEIIEQIKLLEAESEKKDNDLSKVISQKTEEILSKSDLNDKKHDKEIKNLKSRTANILSKSDRNDEKHSKQILDLYDMVRNNTSELSKLKKENTIGIKLTLIVSMTLSISSIILVSFEILFYIMKIEYLNYSY